MVLLKIIGLFMLNLLALWGLAWVMFRDKEDFIDSFVRIFSSEYTYFVPTRCIWHWPYLYWLLNTMCSFNAPSGFGMMALSG